jgi:hypothetical protein
MDGNAGSARGPGARMCGEEGSFSSGAIVMQRTLVELLIKKGLMSKRTLCEEVRAPTVSLSARRLERKLPLI